MDLLIILTILGVTYFTGSLIEKNHYKKIKQREIALIQKPIINFGAKTCNTNKKIKRAQLVTGEVVISGDYFKSFVAGLKNLLGGRLTTYESIMDRGRREALLRMREKAVGANYIVNTRIESIMLNDLYTNQNGSVPQCAIIAYGTAITYE